MNDEIRCVVPTGDICGEGAVWHPEQCALYWTDTNRFLVHRFEPHGQTMQTWFFAEPATSVNLTTDADIFLLVFASQVGLWSPRSHPHIRTIFRLPTAPQMRFNDARVDPRGSLWAGTMRNNVGPRGEDLAVEFTGGILYRIDPDGAVSEWKNGVGISNTVAWSPDRKTFYFGDSPADVIYSFAYDERTGNIFNQKQLFVGHGLGAPDGSAMDQEGFLWNARADAGCLIRIARTATSTASCDYPSRSPQRVRSEAWIIKRFTSPVPGQLSNTPGAYSRSTRRCEGYKTGGSCCQA